MPEEEGEGLGLRGWEGGGVLPIEREAGVEAEGMVCELLLVGEGAVGAEETANDPALPCRGRCWGGWVCGCGWCGELAEEAIGEVDLRFGEGDVGSPPGREAFPIEGDFEGFDAGEGGGGGACGDGDVVDADEAGAVPFDGFGLEGEGGEHLVDGPCDPTGSAVLLRAGVCGQEEDEGCGEGGKENAGPPCEGTARRNQPPASQPKGRELFQPPKMVRMPVRHLRKLWIRRRSGR